MLFYIKNILFNQYFAPIQLKFYNFLKYQISLVKNNKQITILYCKMEN